MASNGAIVCSASLYSAAGTVVNFKCDFVHKVVVKYLGI